MPTKEVADPVTTAQTALTAAVQAETDALEHDRRLRQKVLDSEGTVTAQELADSGHQIERARLGVEAARLTHQAAQRNARLGRLRDLEAEIISTAGSSDDVTAAMAKIREGVTELVTLCGTRQAHFGRWLATMRREGIPNSADTDEVNNHLGWVTSDWTGDTIKAGTRTVRMVRPGLLVEAALIQGAEAAGQSAGSLAPLQLGNNRDLVDDPAGYLTKNW